MQKLVLQRLGHSVIVLVVVSILSFALMRFAPGDPVAALIGEDTRYVDPVEVARMRNLLGLDDPLVVQYGRWLGDAVQGDWGYSLISRQPTLDLVVARIGPTLLLVGTSLVLSILIGLTLGVVSAVKRYSPLDRAITIFAFVGNSMPQVWIGLLLLFAFAVKLGWLPAGGMETLGADGSGSLSDRIKHLILPVMTLSLTSLVGWMRYQRASLLEALGQDYIRVARAKGLTERTVLFRHAWRNSLIPVITLMGSSFGFMIEGAYIVETIFSWPGMGRLGVNAIMARDYPLVMAVAIFSAVFIILGNLLADIAYGLVNPRLKDQIS